MITVTENACRAIEAMTSPTAGVPAGSGVRIAFTADAASGAEPTLTVSVTPGPHPDDEVIDAGASRVFVQPMAAQVLADQVLDATGGDGQDVRFSLRPAQA